MKRTILGLFVVLMGLVFMGCPNVTTDTPADQSIILLAIPGVVAPVRGAVPVTTAIDTAQYTGTIEWVPADNPFAATTVYTANIGLTAKAGWTLTGVTADSFTVAGATATNAVNTGTVAAVFPATFATPILTMVTVPAGSFQRDATPTNISTVSAFRMSEKEITGAQFLAIMGTDPSNQSYAGGTSPPVQMTNWYHAIAFCNKLSIAEGLTPVYSVSGVTDWAALTYASIPTSSNAAWDAVTAAWTNNGYRLPTEMEWEWAAMGAPTDGQGAGTNTTGYLKAFAGSTGSNAIGDYAVFGYYGIETGKTMTQGTNSVGSKLPNELGLYDMSGNVYEWNWDWFDTYPTGAVTDYLGAASGTARVERGGSWGSFASDCTVAYRYDVNPYYQDFSIGFRVVRP